MEATTKTETVAFDRIADIVSDAIVTVRFGKPYIIENDLVSHFMDYVNKFYPEIKIDASFNHEPGKTKLSKR